MKRKPFLHIAAALIALLPACAWASSAPSPAPVPYVKPSSLWPFHAFQVLLMVLGFIAAYRAIRAKLPPGDDRSERQEKEKRTPTYEAEPIPMVQTASPQSQQKARAQVIAVLRGAGVLFMAGGSALAFNSGGFDYGPAHFDEDMVRIFGGTLFVVGLLDFAVLPRLMAGKRETL